jgi:ankyrin repeat protein
MPADLLDLLSKGNAREEELLACLVEDEQGRDPLADRASAGAEKRDKDGWTTLHWAAQDGHSRLAQKLLQLSVAVGSQDSCGATPLMIAAFNNRRDVVEVLLEEKLVDVRQTNHYLSTALHYAAQRGNADIIDMIALKRAEVDALDKHGDTPMSWAARNGHFDAVRKFLELRADPQQDNNASNDSIEMAQEAGHIDIVELLEAHLDENPEG